MKQTTNNSVQQKRFSNTFLLVILIAILYFCYLLFKPFLKEIVIASVLVTIFYPVYLKFVYWSKGRISISSLVVCLLILLIVIVPFSYFVFYLAKQSIIAYGALSPGLNGDLLKFLDAEVWQKLNFVDKNVFDVQQFAIDSLLTVKDWVITGATGLVRGTTQFVVSLLIVLFTMFFMFRDGKALLRRIMNLTPLSNKYDKLIWMKFRDVSYSTIVATFVTSIVQAIIGAIGFMAVGLPGLIPAILLFIFSFLPYVGTAFIWLPASIYLIVIGQIPQGIFLFLWGAIVISLIDNLLRPYMIKGKAQVHQLIIFFSIFGGIIVFGIWGIIFGPLIVSLAFTILHIYELEYSKVLDK
jgi:predicted PurR-regulated permease PerM